MWRVDARFQGVPGACPDRGVYSRSCTDPGADRGGQEAKCGDGLQPLEERLGGLSTQASEFLTRLPSEVARFADCDVVLYQAGADPHVNDPLGGWLTTEQLRERDGLVFSGLKALGIPVAWNLAGGYQLDAAGGISPILELHDNTLRECARVYLS